MPEPDRLADRLAQMPEPDSLIRQCAYTLCSEVERLQTDVNTLRHENYMLRVAQQASQKLSNEANVTEALFHANFLNPRKNSDSFLNPRKNSDSFLNPRKNSDSVQSESQTVREESGEESCDDKNIHETPCSPSRTPQEKSQAIKRSFHSLLSSNSGGRTLSTESVASEKAQFSLEHIVTGSCYELCFGVLIAVNTICMALDAQYSGMDSGHKLEISGYSRTAADTWPGTRSWFQGLDVAFGFMFVFELVVKVLALQSRFVKSWWNLFDACVVICWVASQWGAAMFVNPMILRLFRLVRLARLAKHAKHIEGFDSLRVMLRSINASVAVLLWSTIILFIVQVIIGLCFNSLLMVYIDDVHNDTEIRGGLFRYFGTFSRSMITMCELTFGNFVPVCRYLTDYVSEYYGIAIIIYKVTVGFAMIRVISGVFLHETFKTAASDDELMIMQKKRAQQKHERKMHRFFKQADTSDDGLLQWNEFEAILADESMRNWFSAQDVEVGDGGILFELMDNDGSGQLSIEEVSRGIARLKGPARNLDLVSLMYVTMNLSDALSAIEERLPSQTEEKLCV